MNTCRSSSGTSPYCFEKANVRIMWCIHEHRSSHPWVPCVLQACTASIITFPHVDANATSMFPTQPLACHLVPHVLSAPDFSITWASNLIVIVNVIVSKVKVLLRLKSSGENDNWHWRSAPPNPVSSSSVPRESLWLVHRMYKGNHFWDD